MSVPLPRAFEQQRLYVDRDTGMLFQPPTRAEPRGLQLCQVVPFTDAGFSEVLGRAPTSADSSSTRPGR